MKMNRSCVWCEGGRVGLGQQNTDREQDHECNYRDRDDAHPLLPPLEIYPAWGHVVSRLADGGEPSGNIEDDLYRAATAVVQDHFATRSDLDNHKVRYSLTTHEVQVRG